MNQVFSYDDYRPFLQDWFRAHKRSTGRNGTSEFARLAGCSPSHVRNVLVGRRDLQAGLIAGFCRALSLNSVGADFFSLLVRKAHPLSASDRLQASRELLAVRERVGTLPAPSAARLGRPPKAPPDPVADGFETWAHPIIRALLCCPGVKRDASEIAEALLPAISPVQATAILRRLPHEGESPIVVPSVTDSPRVRAWYRQALNAAKWAIYNTPAQERLIVSSTSYISPEVFRRMRAEVIAWQAEMEDFLRRASRPGLVTRENIAESRPDHPDFVDMVHGAPDTVYTVLVQVFPLSQGA